jgi:hypothetical protein
LNLNKVPWVRIPLALPVAFNIFELKINKYMDAFTELCNRHGTDKGTLVRERHCYSFVYNKLFEPLRDEKLNILEIGIADPAFPGASLRVLYDYFPSATIVGFDIVDCKQFANDRISIIQGDASKSEDLDKAKNAGPYNVIIDDGSHDHYHHIIGFKHLFSSLVSSGVYIIEDLQHDQGWKTIEYFLDSDNTETLKNEYGVQRVEVYSNNRLLAIFKK